MVAINLLDWREKQRIVNNNRFYVVVGMVVACCVILCLGFDSFIGLFVSSERSDIGYINSQLTSVESKIAELNTLKTQKDLLVQRQKVVESLQQSRPFVVDLFNSIPNVMPEGVVLTQMTRKGNEVILSGISDTNADIAQLMDNIQHLKWVQQANLGEIKAITSTSNEGKALTSEGATPANAKESVNTGATANTNTEENNPQAQNTEPSAELNAEPSLGINFELDVMLNPDYTGG